MIDVVIPLGKGSPFQNFELRYCLRSIEKYLKGFRNVYIIGECPEWVTGVIHIPFEDKFNREKNIMRKVYAACMLDNVSEEFLFMNDDHFFLSTTQAQDYPYYYDVNLIDWDNGKKMWDPYKQAIKNTHRELILRELPARHYDIHCPIIYSKFLFKGVMDSYNWDIDFGYTIKSLYANSLEIKGELMRDCKINQPLHPYAIADKLHDRHIFSIGDQALNSHLRSIIENLYPDKSRFER